MSCGLAFARIAAVKPVAPTQLQQSKAPAPDFTLASLDGSQVTLSSYKGKKGWCWYFFATWCVNCMKEVPAIKQFCPKPRARIMSRSLAINYKPNIRISWNGSINPTNINYDILLDTDGKVATGKYDVRDCLISSASMRKATSFIGERLCPQEGRIHKRVKPRLIESITF